MDFEASASGSVARNAHLASPAPDEMGDLRSDTHGTEVSTVDSSSHESDGPRTPNELNDSAEPRILRSLTPTSTITVAHLPAPDEMEAAKPNTHGKEASTADSLTHEFDEPRIPNKPNDNAEPHILRSQSPSSTSIVATPEGRGLNAAKDSLAKTVPLETEVAARSETPIKRTSLPVRNNQKNLQPELGVAAATSNDTVSVSVPHKEKEEAIDLAGEDQDHRAGIIRLAEKEREIKRDGPLKITTAASASAATPKKKGRKKRVTKPATMNGLRMGAMHVGPAAGMNNPTAVGNVAQGGGAIQAANNVRNIQPHPNLTLQQRQAPHGPGFIEYYNAPGGRAGAYGPDVNGYGSPYPQNINHIAQRNAPQHQHYPQQPHNAHQRYITHQQHIAQQPHYPKQSHNAQQPHDRFHQYYLQQRQRYPQQQNYDPNSMIHAQNTTSTYSHKPNSTHRYSSNDFVPPTQPAVGTTSVAPANRMGHTPATTTTLYPDQPGKQPPATLPSPRTSLPDGQPVPANPPVQSNSVAPINQGRGDAPVIDQPVIDQPVIDQPIIDQPVIDQPVIDQPVIDQPVMSSPRELPLSNPPASRAEKGGVTFLYYEGKHEDWVLKPSSDSSFFNPPAKHVEEGCGPFWHYRGECYDWMESPDIE